MKPEQVAELLKALPEGYNSPIWIDSRGLTQGKEPAPYLTGGDWDNGTAWAAFECKHGLRVVVQ